MNGAESESLSDAIAQASSWKIRLNEAPEDDALRAEFELWHSQSPLHQRAWRKVDKAWQLTANTTSPDAGMINRSPAQNPPRIQHSRKSVRKRRLPAMVTVGMAAAIAGIIFARGGSYPFARAKPDYTTGAGEMRVATLPDGTEVTLGPRSALVLHYTLQTRSITMVRGEVFFRVRHDDAHPFAVTSGHTVIRDIGTAFDVRMEDSVTDVSVSEGRVGVTQLGRGDGVQLGAGDEVAMGQNAGTGRVTRVDPDMIDAWTKGHLMLDGLTLEAAIRALSRFYPGIVLTHGFAGDATRVGGVYDIRHPKDALAALVALHGGRIVNLPMGVVLALAGR